MASQQEALSVALRAVLLSAIWSHDGPPRCSAERITNANSRKVSTGGRNVLVYDSAAAGGRSAWNNKTNIHLGLLSSKNQRNVCNSRVNFFKLSSMRCIESQIDTNVLSTLIYFYFILVGIIILFVYFFISTQNAISPTHVTRDPILLQFGNIQHFFLAATLDATFNQMLDFRKTSFSETHWKQLGFVCRGKKQLP